MAVPSPDLGAPTVGARRGREQSTADDIEPVGSCRSEAAAPNGVPKVAHGLARQAGPFRVLIEVDFQSEHASVFADVREVAILARWAWGLGRGVHIKVVQLLTNRGGPAA